MKRIKHTACHIFGAAAFAAALMLTPFAGYAQDPAGGFDFSSEKPLNAVHDKEWLSQELQHYARLADKVYACFHNEELNQYGKCHEALTAFCETQIDVNTAPVKYNSEQERRWLLDESRIYDKAMGDLVGYVFQYMDFKTNDFMITDVYTVRTMYQWSKDYLETDYMKRLKKIHDALNAYHARKMALPVAEARQYPELYGDLTKYFRVNAANNFITPQGEGNCLVDITGHMKSWKKMRSSELNDRLIQFYGGLDAAKAAVVTFRETTSKLGGPSYQVYGNAIARSLDLAIEQVKKDMEEYHGQLEHLRDKKSLFQQVYRMEIEDLPGMFRHHADGDYVYALQKSFASIGRSSK